MIARILSAIEMIGVWPGIGKRRTDLGARPLYTYTVDGLYTIVYTPDKSPLRVFRVAGPGRDLAALAGEATP